MNIGKRLFGASNIFEIIIVKINAKRPLSIEGIISPQIDAANITPAAKERIKLLNFSSFSVGSYILDFYCPGAKLCIELDGAGHQTIDGAEYDRVRTNYLLREHNIRTIRFENRDLYYNLEGVIETITKELRKINPSVASDSSPKTGEQ